MADLNSDFSSSPLLEPDDISVLVHTLLQNSTLPTSVPLESSRLLDNQQCPPAPEIRRQFCGTAFSHSLSGIHFPSHSSYDAANGSEHFRSAFSGAILSSPEGVEELECESQDKDASEVPWKSGPLRSSSKRTRPAEIHNLSEKRRRKRINEKMKALQKLIPNSNKADRASMLDDAIEYLKQLQLQVQILAFQNGSALHPYNIPGVTNSSQPNDLGICFNVVDGLPSSSNGRSSRSTDWKISRKTVFDPAFSTFASSSQKLFLRVALETGNSEHPFPMEHSNSNFQC